MRSFFHAEINLNDPYWEMLARSVYREMDSKKLRFLPVVRVVRTYGSMDVVELTWLPPSGTGKNKAFFNNLETSGCFGGGRKDDSVEDRRSLERILLQTGFNLVQFSMAVFRAFYHFEREVLLHNTVRCHGVLQDFQQSRSPLQDWIFTH